MPYVCCVAYLDDRPPPPASKQYKIYRASRQRPFSVNFIALAVASMKKVVSSRKFTIICRALETTTDL